MQEHQSPQYVNGNSASHEQWAIEAARSQAWADEARMDALRRYRRVRRWAFASIGMVLLIFGVMVFFIYRFVL